MPAPELDARTLVSRAHACHMEAVLFFDREDEASRERSRLGQDGVWLCVHMLDTVGPTWPEAADAIRDVCLAWHADNLADLDGGDWDLLFDDAQDAFVDLGLELELPRARGYFDHFQEQRGRLDAPPDLDAQLRKAARLAQKCVLALGDQPWHMGHDAHVWDEKVREVAETISDLTPAMDASYRLVAFRRLARSVRRIRCVEIGLIGEAWTAVRRASLALSRA
jgi:hypothetical protein